MPIETLCSGCGQTLAVDDQHAGKKARCPACGQIYTVPLLSPASSDYMHASGSMGDSGLGTASEELSTHPSLAATTAGSPLDRVASNHHIVDEFWLETASGDQYGPVDRSNLNRWFEEGRVGQGYRIRQGVNGPWQPADLFRPAAGNPYASYTASAATSSQSTYSQSTSGNSPYSPSGGSLQFQKGDPSGLILTMGILSWIFFLLGCVPISWIPGLIAWLRGGTALQEIRNGITDPTNTSLVQVGYYLGMVNVIITLLAVIAIAAFTAIAIIVG